VHGAYQSYLTHCKENSFKITNLWHILSRS